MHLDVIAGNVLKKKNLTVVYMKHILKDLLLMNNSVIDITITILHLVLSLGVIAESWCIHS